MMLYLFVESNGNHELRGVEVAELPPEVVAKQTELTNDGYNLSDSSKYTEQLLNGAKNGMVPEADLSVANAKIAELEKQLRDAGIEPGKTGQEQAAN